MTFQKRRKETRKLVRQVSGEDRSKQTNSTCNGPEAVPECPRNSKRAVRAAGADSESQGPEVGVALGYSKASKRVMRKERMVSQRWSGDPITKGLAEFEPLALPLAAMVRTEGSVHWAMLFESHLKGSLASGQTTRRLLQGFREEMTGLGQVGAWQQDRRICCRLGEG